MSNPKNSNSCNHLKEDELPDLNNIIVQNISQDNKVYNVSPKKAQKSHNTSSILQTEAINKLQEALQPIKNNIQLHYTHESST